MRNVSFRDFFFLFLQFGIVFNLGDIYYQQQIVGKHLFHLTKAHKSPYLWAMLHMSLSISILYFSAAIKLLNTDYEGEQHHHEMMEEGKGQQLNTTFPRHLSAHQHSFHDEKYLCSCVTISLLLIYLMRLQHKGLADEGKLRLRKWSYAFKFFCSLACSGVPWIAQTTTQCMAYLFAITGLLIIQDLVSHEGHLRIEDDHENVATDALEDPKTFFERSDSLHNLFFLIDPSLWLLTPLASSVVLKVS
jgi:hypothetical protein